MKWNKYMKPATLSTLYKMEYYSVIKNDEIMHFDTTWMKLVGFRVNEVNQKNKH